MLFGRNQTLESQEEFEFKVLEGSGCPEDLGIDTSVCRWLRLGRPRAWYANDSLEPRTTAKAVSYTHLTLPTT